MTLTFRNRRVVDLEIDGIDRRDAPDFSDAFFSAGVWGDTGEALTDAELDALTEERSDAAQEMAREWV